jgi:ATP-dependent RNA helicase DeaD
MQKQIDAIAAGAQVICGTPGRVLDHLRRGTLDPRGIRLVVLDESDEMLSMGFERELNAILEYMPPERQTLLFSATLPPDIERIARNKLKSPEFVTLSGDHVGALSIHHYVYMVSSDKITALLRVIEVDNPEGAIVFCNTKDETERVAGALQRQGFEADWLNGDLDQGEREKVMRATKEGRIRFLVATDVAARGIDISHLTHVINFDFPQDAESYVHRTGRTGRAGRTGTAISLVTPQDIGQLYLLRLTYKIRPIEKQIPSDSEVKTRAEADLVLMFAEGYSKKAVHPDDLSLARRLLTHDSAEVILAGLLRDHLGARPSAREEASANRRVAKPRPAEAQPSQPAPVTTKAPTRDLRPALPPEARPAPAPAPIEAAPAVVAPVVAPTNPAIAEVRPQRGTAPLPRETSATSSPQVAAREAPVAAAPVAPRVVVEAAPPVEIAPVTPPSGGGVLVLDEQPTGQLPAIVRETPDNTVPMSAIEPTLPYGRGAPGAATPVSGIEPAVLPVVSEPRPIEGRYGRRDDRRGDRGRRGRDRDARPPRDPNERAAPRPDFSDGARERAAAERPLDRAKPAGEGGAKAFVRHADFTTWQPPEEEGDDEPIWGDSRDARPTQNDARQAPPRDMRQSPPSDVRQSPPNDVRSFQQEARQAAPQRSAAAPVPANDDDAVGAETLPVGETVELHVSVGRRDGARASDLVRVLEKAGLSKESVQRVRVRERHAFLTVRKEDEERALAALSGQTIAGRVVVAERARERHTPAEGTPEQGGGDEPAG